MRLLIVSYYFPPAAGGGVQRVLKFAKYLPEFGVEVDVLTPDDPQWLDSDGGLDVPEGTTVHRSKYYGPPPGKPRDILHGKRGLDRVMTILKLQPRRVLLPDLHAGWALSAVPAGKRIVRDRKIDVVMSTSPPETDHVIGRRVSKAMGVPWVADMRDSWLNEPGLRTDLRSVRAKLAVNRRISARTVGAADLVLTVSDPISDEIRGHYPDVRVQTLMNAVDLDDFRDLPDVSVDTGRFVVTYTGNFFGRRSPRPFLEAVDRLLLRRPELTDTLVVRFIGSLKEGDGSWIDGNERLSRMVERITFMPYAEALAHQRSSDMLYLAIASGDRHQGEVTGKLFEYLGARRPILAVVPPDGAAATLVRELDAGVIVSPDAPADIERVLEHAIDARARDGRAADVSLDDAAALRISRRGRAQELAGLLGELVQTTSPDSKARAR